MPPDAPSRRTFLAASVGALVAPSAGFTAAPPAITVPTGAVTGPMVGHVSHEDAVLWIRPAQTGGVTLVVQPAAGGPEIRVQGTAEQARDQCVALTVRGLTPATTYTYRFEQETTVIGQGSFRTWAASGTPARVSLALGSCAYTESSPVWSRMKESGCEALLLMGDTPYIDSYELATARQRHREFLHIPELRPLLATWPVWGTWDDHDFGLNAHLGDSDPVGKQHTRQAFVEYRALAGHGGSDGGIYTRFRTGPIEVWLLDPRWFSNTEPSPVDPARPTCFGATQWAWLLRTLKESTAPFKLLAMGEVWKDKENAERDDLGTFPHERDALFDFIRREMIGGVMVFGGDIHCSRHLVTPGRLGYDLHDFVSSPIHRSTIPSLNVPHPDLVWGRAEPRTFLRLVADSTVTPPRCTATFINAAGVALHEAVVTAAAQ
jgi:alkaline phosphatase D